MKKNILITNQLLHYNAAVTLCIDSVEIILSVMCRNVNLEEYGLQMYFAQDFEVQGEVKTIALKPGGEDLLVTEENKDEYIEYVDG